MGACPIRIHLVPFTCFVSWATTVVPAVSVLPTHRHEQRAQWRRSALCRLRRHSCRSLHIGSESPTRFDSCVCHARDRSGLLPSAAPARSRSAEVERPACWKRIQRAAGLSRALGHVLPSCSFGPRRECWRRRTRKFHSKLSRVLLPHKELVQNCRWAPRSVRSGSSAHQNDGSPSFQLPARMHCLDAGL